MEETLRVALDARRAYYRAVAAREVVGFLAQSKAAAETATQLARRLGETGAMNKLDQAREQVFYAEITAQLAAQEQRSLTRARAADPVARALGRTNQLQTSRIDAGVAARMRAVPEIEVEAVRRRVDLQIARMEVDAVAKSYGLTNATRFLNLLELAGIAKKKTERETGERDNPRGFEVELQVPLFDFGEVRVRQAEETYMQAVNRLAEKAVNVRSEARDAYRRYRSTLRHRAALPREVLPLRKIISDETLLRYNAMQIDVFALLAEARQRIAATIAAIEAQRDFWLASADLDGRDHWRWTRRWRRCCKSTDRDDRRQPAVTDHLEDINDLATRFLGTRGGPGWSAPPSAARAGGEHSRSADEATATHAAAARSQQAGRTTSRS